ncbi:hypothetical protein D3C72_2323470 [compost metagenome]
MAGIDTPHLHQRHLDGGEREQPGADQCIGERVQRCTRGQRIGIAGEGFLEAAECGVARGVAHALGSRVCATRTASLAGMERVSRTICTRSGV